MRTDAVLLERPGRIALARLTLDGPAFDRLAFDRLAFDRLAFDAPGADDLLVAVDWSGISTGTERLLFAGQMPDFPGMGYPLVPGYEAVGRVIASGPDAPHRPGTPVFVPGAQCFGAVRGLFGAAASRLVVPGARALALGPPDDVAPDPELALLALAATARHALVAAPALPELIVGHGVLGRLLARLVVAAGGAPVVWERDTRRAGGDGGYIVLDPDADARRDYRSIVDCSGDASLLDALVGRSARGGAIVLAGFYPDRVGFSFAPAFMREITLRIAAEWQPDDLRAVRAMVSDGTLSLGGLVSHRSPAADAANAYRTAFEDAACTKMVLDWSAHA